MVLIFQGDFQLFSLVSGPKPSNCWIVEETHILGYSWVVLRRMRKQRRQLN